MQPKNGFCCLTQKYPRCQTDPLGTYSQKQPSGFSLSGSGFSTSQRLHKHKCFKTLQTKDLLDIGQEVDDVHVCQVFLEGNSSCTPTRLSHILCCERSRSSLQYATVVKRKLRHLPLTSVVWVLSMLKL